MNYMTEPEEKKKKFWIFKRKVKSLGKILKTFMKEEAMIKS